MNGWWWVLVAAALPFPLAMLGWWLSLFDPDDGRVARSEVEHRMRAELPEVLAEAEMILRQGSQG